MSQEEIVKNRLRQTGRVSRNWCLQRYISRLSAIMLGLKKKGWKFSTKNEDGNYVYILEQTPDIQEVDYTPEHKQLMEMKRQKSLI
jgi:hypothetical protein|tara:strand:- start:1513 stop:1770 length:258 start_codon:yes stop_codon:yes gene_type:complete